MRTAVTAVFDAVSGSLRGRDTPALAARLFWVLLAIVLVTSLALLALGPPIIIRFIDDMPILLDGGWRVYQGHLPHVDFYTPLGPVTLMLVGLGMVLAGPSVQGMVVANVIVLVVTSLWAWMLGRSRMAAVPALLFALYVCFVVAGVQVFGWDLTVSGFSAVYNRYATALLALLLVESFGHVRAADDRTGSHAAFLGGVSSGILLVLLFFLKLNYFGIALLGIGVGPLATHHTPRRWWGVVAGAAAALVAMLAYLHFDVGAVWHDISMGVRARSGMMFDQLFDYVGNLFHRFPTESVVPLTLLFLTWRAAPSRGGVGAVGIGRLAPRVRQAGVVLFLLLSHVAIFISNTQEETPALFPLAGLLLLSEYRERTRGETWTDGAERRRTLGPLAGYTVLLTALLVVPNAASMAYAAHYKANTTITMQFDSPSLYNLYPKQDSTYGKEYFVKMHDGMTLLRDKSSPGDRIVVLDFTNPFSLALLRPSPRGDALWWHEHLSFSEDVHLPPERVFAQADVVMLAQTEAQESLLIDLYGPYLQRHFTLTARTDHWRLFHHNQAGP
jgi:hypothetical protein